MLMVGKYPLNNVNKKIIVIGKKKKKNKNILEVTKMKIQKDLVDYFVNLIMIQVLHYFNAKTIIFN